MLLNIKEHNECKGSAFIYIVLIRQWNLGICKIKYYNNNNPFFKFFK